MFSDKQIETLSEAIKKAGDNASSGGSSFGIIIAAAIIAGTLSYHWANSTPDITVNCGNQTPADCFSQNVKAFQSAGILTEFDPKSVDINELPEGTSESVFLAQKERAHFNAQVSKIAWTFDATP